MRLFLAQKWVFLSSGPPWSCSLTAEKGGRDPQILMTEQCPEGQLSGPPSMEVSPLVTQALLAAMLTHTAESAATPAPLGLSPHPGPLLGTLLEKTCSFRSLQGPEQRCLWKPELHLPPHTWSDARGLLSAPGWTVPQWAQSGAWQVLGK